MTIRNTCFIVLVFIFLACRRDNNDLLPENAPYVDITIVLGNQEYLPLNFDRGFVYVNGGYRGITVYRESVGDYRAFDRACPYHFSDTCGIVSVDSSSFFMRDPCCGSQFDFSGAVGQGPANRPLIRYTTYLEGNLLRILN